MVLCEPLPEFSRGPQRGEVVAILEKSARFAFNLVDQQYGHVSRDWKFDILLNPKEKPDSVMVMYSCDVNTTELAMHVADFVRQSWRELMEDIRRHGVAAFLRA